jgi:hypothetical protein
MLDYCTQHKNVKYAIFDEYDRYMRSVNEGPYFEVLFQLKGVKVWYASESDTFNGDDAMAKLMRALSAFKAEGSNEERQRKSISGQEKAIREGRYPFHPKPGYMKGVKAGRMLPHPTEFEPFKKALKDIAYRRRSPSEALVELNESSFTESRALMKIDKFKKYIVDEIYAGIIDVNKQVKARNEHALHEPMITPKEHKMIVEVMDNIPALHHGVRANYNEFFNLNTIISCPCDMTVGCKFVGFTSNNGHGRIYNSYRGRICNKTISRDEANEALTDYLDSIVINEEYLEQFSRVLKKV